MDRSPFQLTDFPPKCLCATFPGYAPRRAIIAPVSRSDKPASLAPALYQSWRSLALAIPFGRSASTPVESSKVPSPPTYQSSNRASSSWSSTCRPLGCSGSPCHRRSSLPRRGDRMSSRREFITLLGGAAAWPLSARAQQLARRIGILETIPPQANAANFDALRKGLRELGYDEGRSLIIEYRSADGRAERFPALAAELVRLNVDVIVTRGTPSALAARNATRTTPIVMASVGDVIGTGLAVSLARPGGNVTGLTAINTDTEAKRLELLKEMVPGLVRIAALYNMGNPTFALRWKEVELAARALGAESQLLDVRKPEDIAPAFAAATAQRAGALLMTLDALIQANQRTILELAAKHRLPAIYPTREFVENGGLMAYGVSYPDLYRRAATYIDKIFKGAKPADLPIEQPTRFELVVNLKTAKTLGLEVPPTLLALADEVIE